MKRPNKVEKIIGLSLIRIVGPLKPRWGTVISIYFYKKWGMSFCGKPNYISSRCWFDGSDYSSICIGEGCTISSNVSFLTHDWSLYTIGNALEIEQKKPLGRHLGIKVDDFVFIGRNVILMPGATIGRGTVIGAGSTVRGVIPDYSIVIGNPCQIIGDSREYFKKKTNIG